MPAPSPDEFWKLLVRTRLLEPGAAESLRAEYEAQPPAARGDGSARSIAAWLYGREVLTRWQAKRVSAGDSGPFFMGDYRLLERHDWDGESLLFTARHEPSGKPVALVLLNAKRCRRLDIWTEVVRRTTAANRAADPMLSRTWSLEHHEGSRFIVCELVNGGNLADEVERLGALPPRPAGVLAWQIARAVAELHGLGVVHGGLSLDALRREPPPAGGGERTGRVRLLQYPLVADPQRVPLLPAIASDEEIARLARRAAFVAPELLVPGAECDERSDVYAIGAILYALLAGMPPCWEGDPKATLRQASFAGPAPLPDTVPAELAGLVAYMMARDPAERYQTAGESADAIAACLGLESLPVAPVASPAPSFVVHGGDDDGGGSAGGGGEEPFFSIDVQPAPRAASRTMPTTMTPSNAAAGAGAAADPAAVAQLAIRRRAWRLRMIGLGIAAAVIAAVNFSTVA